MGRTSERERGGVIRGRGYVIARKTGDGYDLGVTIRRFAFGLLFAAATGSVCAADRVPTEHDVLPILLRRCGLCHAAIDQEAGLDLRSRETMLKGGESGPAIDLKNPKESLILKKIAAGEMPPEGERGRAGIEAMTPEEADTIVKWITAGAPETPEDELAAAEPEWTEKQRAHWAFVPPKRTSNVEHRTPNIDLY
ncbi:MAG: hypothetical protein HKN23_16880, partial [Verrucomicrobiales bacterium]|nr:hypothetical protein [Verrucomicrobiales bacterium]